MKSILIYGDSLTWGSVPGAPKRHERDTRWPNVMANELGANYEIITDGLRGRLTAYDENLADCNRNASQTLPTALYAHAPLDLVILMLGTNDMQPHIAGTSIAAMQGMRRLVTIVQTHFAGPYIANPKVLIVAPPKLCKTDDEFFTGFFDGTIEQSFKIADYYHQIAQEKECSFFDAGLVAQTSPIDGVHLDAQNTINIGKALAPVVKQILN
jgi:lysophospholipase L1-like esterase